jgi:hypothetical protein
LERDEQIGAPIAIEVSGHELAGFEDSLPSEKRRLREGAVPVAVEQHDTSNRLVVAAGRHEIDVAVTIEVPAYDPRKHRGPLVLDERV